MEGAFAACGPIGSSPSSLPATSSGPAYLVVDPSTSYQTIDGFGGADTWAPGGPLSDDAAKLFFDLDAGIGLSLLRVGIEVNGTPMGGDAVYSDIKLAATYGVRVWGAPWSPPASDKDNANAVDGGDLCAAAGMGACTGDAYDAWATILAQFATTVQAQTGVTLYGVSAQNEPDFVAQYYSSCTYSGDQMVSFLNVLGPKLRALDAGVKLIAPEPDQWQELWSGRDYGTKILADPTANSLVDVLATHDYGFSPKPPPAGVTQPIWETEVAGLKNPNDLPTVAAGPNVTIDNGLTVAQWVHDAITIGGASAWHYWWLVTQNSYDNEGLIFQPGKGPDAGPGGQPVGDVTSPPKRLYTVGNYSKFVRPGYKRIDVSGSVPASVLATAYQDPAKHTIAIVAINNDTKDATFQLSIAGGSGSNPFTPWVTSATDNLAMKPAIALDADAGAFTVTLPAESVTTLVGQP